MKCILDGALYNSKDFVRSHKFNVKSESFCTLILESDISILTCIITGIWNVSESISVFIVTF